MNQIETFNLFPIPITKIKHDPIDEKIIDFIKSIDYMFWRSSNTYYKNINHERKHFLSMSQTKNVLEDHPELLKLKKLVLKTARIYWDEVICGDENLELVIINSWITKHELGEKNPQHIHAALFSGCFYLEVPENSGDLIFYKDNNYLNLFPSFVDIDFHTKNLINSKSFRITPEKNSAVFFPGHLNHETGLNENTEPRFVLTVDFKIKGTTRKNSGGFELHY